MAGVDPADLADPRRADDALDNVEFLVSLEVRMSPVARRADVVFPVAPVVEKAGTFVDWEGRTRTFEAVLTTTAMSDARILDALAAEFDVELGCARRGTDPPGDRNDSAHRGAAARSADRGVRDAAACRATARPSWRVGTSCSTWAP